MNQKHSADTEIIWKDTRLAEIGRIVAGGTPSTSDPNNWNGTVAWVTPADLSGRSSRHLTTTERTLTELGLATSAARLLPPRSLVISSRAPIGHMALPLVSFCTNQGCKSIEFFDGQDPDFHYYNLRFWVRRLHDKGEGTTFSEISKKALEAVEVPVPSNRKVQETIASVLALLDRAIEQTEALLAKQQRIKTGLMHDLLTRGLDAQGRLRDPSTHAFKPSPLGPIPTEWTAVYVEDLCDDIVDCPHSTPKYELGGFPCIRTADMVPGKLLLQNAYRVSSSTYQERISRLVPRKGDIIYSREGERLGIASPVGDELVCLGQRVMLLRPKAETDSTFLTWAMNSPSFYNRVVLGQIATTSPHINVRDIKKALVVRPEPTEQQLIGEALAADDSERSALENCLEKLRRQKGGLMHDLLTGLVPVTPLLANPEAPISP
ncbi:MAG: hypothetical protein A2075_04800 [Geobacteraceae bacterium GWC2_58_44]|nr:MAG: hypothetical protein A2075_04800 [Geobacteraceae bacterium GWC2_58_44]